MKPYRVSTDAQLDIVHVAHYMECQRRGYGQIFDDMVEATIERIRRTPGVFQGYAKEYQRCRMHRFPYFVYYQVIRDEVVILRIIHTRRDRDRALDENNDD